MSKLFSAAIFLSENNYNELVLHRLISNETSDFDELG